MKNLLKHVRSLNLDPVSAQNAKTTTKHIQAHLTKSSEYKVGSNEESTEFNLALEYSTYISLDTLKRLYADQAEWTIAREIKTTTAAAKPEVAH
jgi:hypothetical protein